MRKEDFKQKYLEQQIFDELKDSPLKNSEVFRKKYQGADIDHTRLYRRIVNYQIKTYGSTLDAHIPKRKYQDKERINTNARMRKYYRLNKENK